MASKHSASYLILGWEAVGSIRASRKEITLKRLLLKSIDSIIQEGNLAVIHVCFYLYFLVSLKVLKCKIFGLALNPHFARNHARIYYFHILTILTAIAIL